MMRRDRHDDLGRFLTALGAFVLVAVVLPLGAIAASQARFGSADPLAGVDPPWRWFAGGSTLSEPVADDTVVDGLIRLSLCTVWIVAIVVVVTTVLEIVHLVRHRGLAMPSVRGLGWAQRIARFIATGLLVVMPMLTSSASVASVPRASITSLGDMPNTVVQPRHTFSTDQPPEASATTSVHTHVVQPGESVYSIAEGLARGDGARVIAVADAIVEANLGSTMGPGRRFTNAAYVEAGWILQIPAEFADPPAPVAGPPIEHVTEHVTEPVAEPASRVYEVQRGDTLWDIADEQLGDPTRWTDIWDRNAGDDMGGGRTFDDPDLILPGWDLELGDDPAIEIDDGVQPDVVPELAPEVVPDNDIASDTRPEPTVEPPVEPPVESTVESTVEPPAGNPRSTAPVAASTGPLPLTPEASTRQTTGTDAATATSTTTSADASTTTSATTSTTTVVPIGGGTRGVDESAVGSPGAPSPIRLEHAALLAAGVLALVGVRRRQRLRAARPRHRVPEPRPEVMATERRLRAVDAGERALRVDVACRAAAWSMIDTGAQIGWVRVSIDGDVEIRTTATVALPAPWSPRSDDGQQWQLGAEVPVELLAEDARRVGMPCVALAQLGVNGAGDDVLVDIEACGVLAVEAWSDQADEVIAGLAAGLASSMYAEVAHLIGVALAPEALLGHRNAHRARSLDDALELAAVLVGTTADQEHTTFELRSLRTGGEMWEPAIVLLGDTTAGSTEVRGLPAGGHGVGVVVVAAPGALADAPVRLVGTAGGWALEGFGTSIELTPVGLTAGDLAAIHEVLVEADRPLEAIELGSADEVTWAESDTADAPRPPGTRGRSPASDVVHGEEVTPFAPMDHRIVVGLLGRIEVRDLDGNPGRFERSKTVELISWLATHRERSTRSGARTALWELDVRDATFANVVSEARRGLARLVAPPDGEEWVGRTLTEQLPLHHAVVTDADLVDERVTAARLQPPAQAIDTLRPAVAMIRDLPFAGTSYLWPDAEGITSNLVLLAITATTDFAAHALSLGDTDGVFWATGHGLRVLPGHEELIGLRMRAHARSGDLAGVRQEWESYERVVTADPWSDGEPSPTLLDLRHHLLS
jgi:MYXO-CTERM domain-containing protein